MKKWTAVWMAVLLFALPLLSAAEGTEEAPVYPEELLVGNPTEMKGDFFTEMFGNNTADIDMRALIHGYNLVSWDENQGEYRFDPSVVTNVLLMQNENGDHTYYMALARDLYYSDGTQITAWDYAFSLLLMMRPEMEEIGARIYRQEHLRGSAAYISGAAREMSGVQVLSDYQLAVTLDGAYLPFFYETGLLLCVPYPIRVIAPGCRVYDEGKGAYIGNEDPAAAEPVFTTELLRKTILDPETGYLSHPSVSSGPYRLVSFDGVTAHAELNPYHKGKWVPLPEKTADENPEGEEPAEAEAVPENYNPVYDDDGNLIYYLSKPSIAKIAFTCVKSENAAQLFAEEQIHVVNKLVYGPAIQEMLQRPADEEPAEGGDGTEAGDPGNEAEDYRFMNYPRLGMTMVAFSCDRPAVKEKEVRQAIAWCMDRDAMTQDYTAGYGQRVDGYYGIEKWENVLVSGRIDPPVTLLEDGAEAPHKFENLYASNDTEYEAMMEAWHALNLDGLTVYTVDTEKAAALLEGAGWKKNDDGLRQKEIDGETLALDLKLMYPEGNRIAESMEENFLKNLEEAGIRVTLVPAPMDTVLSEYYHETERTTDMIYLGTNFHVVFDPSITYSTAQNARWNHTFSEDEELYQRAVELRQTEPGDLYTYISRWIAFQERYNEVLPAIPIYSNIYFDFCVPYLQNYNPGSHTTWSQAITESWFGEEPAAEEPEE